MIVKKKGNTYSCFISQVFERVKTIQRGSLAYVIVEPDDDEASSFFTTYIIDSATGESLSTVKIPCGANYDDVTYVGNYLLWTEEDTLNWTPIDKNEVKSTLIKVSIRFSLLTSKILMPSTSLLSSPCLLLTSSSLLK
jgi:hypothetical protein